MPPEDLSEKKLPRISILIPVYNSERYLAECLDSILAQDFGDFEILISDDGSKDNSLALIKAYAAKDARIRWWQNPRNLGLTQNHNACLKEARGEFIKYLHQDDKFLHPSVLSRMAAVLEQNATVTLVATSSHIIDEHGRVLAERNHFPPGGIFDGKKVIVRCLEANKNLVGEPTVVMFRRSQAIRGFDERFRQILDMEFSFHLLEQGQFYFLPEPLIAYRVHQQQATKANQQSGTGAEDHLLMFLDYYRKPWLAEYGTRRMWFKQIYYLRKQYGSRAKAVTDEAMTVLKPFWYLVFWLEHRVTRPLQKLRTRFGRKA
jgi:glycosyltransferase involved in cell wall biosynthesis